MRYRLLSPDPPDSSGDLPETPPDSGGGGNPAASDVVASDLADPSSAADLEQIRSDLERERQERKREQVRLSELEDENRQLKSIGLKPTARKSAKDWLEEL